MAGRGTIATRREELDNVNTQWSLWFLWVTGTFQQLNVCFGVFGSDVGSVSQSVVSFG